MIYNSRGINCWNIVEHYQVGWIHLDFEKVFIDYDSENIMTKFLEIYIEKSLRKGWLNF